MKKKMFSGEQKNVKKKINFQILMGIFPRGTKLHILHDSDTESRFLPTCSEVYDFAKS